MEIQEFSSGVPLLTALLLGFRLYLRHIQSEIWLWFIYNPPSALFFALYGGSKGKYIKNLAV